MQGLAVRADPGDVGPRVALGSTLEVKVVPYVHFHVLGGRLEDDRLA